MRTPMFAFAGVIVGVTLYACTRSEPPTPPGSPSVAVPEVPVATAVESSTPERPPRGGSFNPTLPEGSPAQDSNSRARVNPSPTDRGAANASTPAPLRANPSASDQSADAASTLEQTRDRPSASGQAFSERVQSLWKAIVHDDPNAALPFFFPKSAYERVKNVGDPDADWNHRLLSAYRHDIHALHAKLGGDADNAKLVTLDVPSANARWVEPGEEWNKLGYYRVYGSKLRYEVAGDPRVFDVKSLISWRGEWYVVHLSGIR